jgi:hypothetical protein
MIYDLLILLLIVAFSYVFKLSQTKNYDSQLIFILLSVLTIVIYKYAMYRQLAKQSASNEGYQDFTDEINQFLNKDVPQGATQSSINDYKTSLAKLQDKVDLMNEYLAELKSAGNQTSGAADGLDGSKANELNIQASQQIQDYRLNKLRDEIRRTQDIITQTDLARSATKYNKIKVLSSCIVSNADGSYSKDAPTPSTTGGSGSLTGSQSRTLTPEGLPLPARSSNTEPAPTPQVQQRQDQASGDFDLSILQKYLSNPININLRA